VSPLWRASTQSSTCPSVDGRARSGVGVRHVAEGSLLDGRAGARSTAAATVAGRRSGRRRRSLGGSRCRAAVIEELAAAGFVVLRCTARSRSALLLIRYASQLAATYLLPALSGDERWCQPRARRRQRPRIVARAKPTATASATRVRRCGAAGRRYRCAPGAPVNRPRTCGLTMFWVDMDAGHHGDPRRCARADAKRWPRSSSTTWRSWPIAAGDRRRMGRRHVPHAVLAAAFGGNAKPTPPSTSSRTLPSTPGNAAEIVGNAYLARVHDGRRSRPSVTSRSRSTSCSSA
jgi:hypothetical protein